MELWYDVFGAPIVVRSTRRDVIRLLRAQKAAWSRLACAPAARAAVELDVLIHPPPGPLHEVQQFANASFFLDAGRHRLITGNCGRRPWQVHVQSWLDDAFRVVHAMVVPTLLDLVERRGFSSMHAAAVAHRGRGVLLCGDTGSGKSTSSLALVAHGFEFLTDNDAYLESTRAGVRVRSRGGAVALRPASLRLLGGLPSRAGGPAFRGKRLVEVARVRSGAQVHAASARLLLFPQVGSGPRSRFRPLSPAEALARLLASYPLGGSVRSVLGDGWAQRQRFERLSRLVAAAPAYAVRLGSDLDAFGARVRDLLR